MSAIILHCNHKNPHLFATELFFAIGKPFSDLVTRGKLSLFLKREYPKGEGVLIMPRGSLKKKESQWLQQRRGYCIAVPSTALKKVFVK